MMKRCATRAARGNKGRGVAQGARKEEGREGGKTRQGSAQEEARGRAMEEE